MSDALLRPARRYRTRRRRRPLLAALAVVAFAAVAAAATLGVRLAIGRGEPLPGVQVLGASIGGLGRKAAEARIVAAAGRRLAHPVAVGVAGGKEAVDPSRILKVDASATFSAAAHPRSFWTRVKALLSPAPPRIDVEPVLQVRRATAVAALAPVAAHARPAAAPTIVVIGAEPAVRPGRAGSRLETGPLIDAIARRVATGEGRVVARFAPEEPPISDAAAADAAARARQALASPVSLGYRGAQLVSLAPAELAKLLRFEPAGDGFRISLDGGALATSLAPRLQRLLRKPADARFVVKGGKVAIIPSKDGVAVAPDLLARAVLAGALAPSHAAELELKAVPPELTTGKARALGIRKPIASYTTQMGASSADRIWNVHLMADFINGAVILPGKTFSFNERVGPRTAARGFREGQEIIGTLTVPSIGGGVCQTATTLFNDALVLGLPVTARVNHSFYLYHYPLGRDATVSWGGPDLVFRNDMKHGLLIEARYTAQTLTFTFWGTDEGRRVKLETGPKLNPTTPKMAYALDLGAPQGSVKVVQNGPEEGFDVTVDRTVLDKDGNTIRQDSFFSRYVPVGPTTVYGPGQTVPRPYVVIPAQTG